MKTWIRKHITVAGYGVTVSFYATVILFYCPWSQNRGGNKKAGNVSGLKTTPLDQSFTVVQQRTMWINTFVSVMLFLLRQHQTKQLILVISEKANFSKVTPVQKFLATIFCEPISENF